MKKRTSALVAAAATCCALLLPADALASKDDVGKVILDCFHPSGIFDGVRVTSPNWGSDGIMSVRGRIDFRGRLTDTPYFMNFVYYEREVGGQTEFRVLPGSDSAPFPPNPSCSLREWTPAY